MKVIVGLGNPGKKYDNTRHNIGFEALDYIADKEGISINTGKHKALIGTGYMGGEKVLLVKPQTFMNLSGESLRPIMDFYKLEPEDFIIIHDDIDLDAQRPEPSPPVKTASWSGKQRTAATRTHSTQPLTPSLREH